MKTLPERHSFSLQKARIQYNVKKCSLFKVVEHQSIMQIKVVKSLLENVHLYYTHNPSKFVVVKTNYFGAKILKFDPVAKILKFHPVGVSEIRLRHCQSYNLCVSPGLTFHIYKMELKVSILHCKHPINYNNYYYNLCSFSLRKKQKQNFLRS